MLAYKPRSLALSLLQLPNVYKEQETVYTAHCPTGCNRKLFPMLCSRIYSTYLSVSRREDGALLELLAANH